MNPMVRLLGPLLRSVAGLVLALGVLPPAGGPAGEDKAERPAGKEEAEELFVRRIAGVLQTKCLACHGNDPKKIRGGLDLRSRDGLLRGGHSKTPAIVPGDPPRRPLYLPRPRRQA